MDTRTLDSNYRLFLDGLTCYDYVDQTLVLAASESFTDMPSVTLRKDFNRATEISKVKEFAARVKDGFVENTYKRSGKSKSWGRCYAKGLATITRCARNAIVADTYYDLDMVCASYTILYDVLCKDYPEYRFDYIQRVVTSRQQLCAEHNVEKIHWNIFLFYDNPHTRTDFERNLVADIERARSLIQKENKTLYDFVRRAKGKTNDLGSFLSYYVNEVETRIVSHLMDYLWREKRHVLEKEGKMVISYEYDGLKMLKELVDSSGGVDMLLDTLNGIIKSLGFAHLHMVNKPMDERYIITPEAMEQAQAFIDLNAEWPAELDEISALTVGERSISMYIKEKYSGWMVHQFGTFYFFDGQKWNKYDKTPHKLKVMLSDMIMTDVNERLERNKHVADPASPWYQEYQKLMFDVASLRTMLDSNTKLNLIIDFMRSLFNDENIQFDDKEMLLGFNNGVYDLETGEFREHRYEDYLTMSVGYDFVADRDSLAMQEEEMKMVIGKIMTDPAKRHLLMVVLSTTLCGKNIEKFFILNGNGRNGKGLLDELLMSALGQYGYYAEPVLLTKDMNSTGPNPQLAQVSRKRGVVVKEPEVGAKLTSMYKSLTGGGQLNARNCFSNDTRVFQNLTLLAECNCRPLLKETPRLADKARIVDIEYESSFTHHEDDYEEKMFVPDPKYKTKEWRDEHRMAFMYILMDAFKHFRDSGYKIDPHIPASVLARSENYLEQNNPISALLDLVIEPEEGGMVQLREVLQYLKFMAKERGFLYTQCREITKANLRIYLEKKGYELNSDMIMGYRINQD